MPRSAPPCRPPSGRRLRARIAAVLVLAAAPASAQIAAPAAEAPAPPAPERPRVQPIPVAEIGVRAEKVKSQLADLEDQLAPTKAVLAVEERLPVLRERIERQVADATEVIRESPALLALDELKLRWSTLREEVARHQAALTARSAEVEKQVERVRSQREVWAATREAAIAAEAPPEVVSQIDEVIAAIAVSGDRIRARQGALVQLQGRVAQLDQEVSADLKRLDEVRQGIVGKVFRPESAPIWSAQSYQLVGGGEIWRRIAESQRRDIETARSFAAEHVRAIALHGALLASLLVTMFMARRRVRLRAGDPDLVTVRAIFEHPVALSLLLIVLLATWTLPQPRPVAQVVAIAALFPAVLILRSVLERPVFPLLNALVVLWVVERVRALLAPLPQAPRLIFMAEMLGLIALLAWWLRPARLVDIPAELAHTRFFRVLAIGARVVLAGSVLALLAEATGYSALGRLVGGGVLFAAYGGVILYGAIRVLDGLLALLLRLRPLRLLGMVQRHRWLIRSRVLFAFEVGAAVWWAAATLRRFEIADDVWRGLAVAFSAELHVGNAVLSLGSIVAFGITLWLALWLSRFVRFVLDEDVYTRVPLRKGMPYAISALANYLILLLGFVLAVLALGIDLNRFALIAGAFGVGIGFGLQNIVNNFVSGLILLTERPVEVGDTVELGSVLGSVQRIGIRSSTVRTLQGAEVIVPNAQLVSEQVINWTHSDRRRRIEIPVGVAYGSDPKRVMAVLLEVAKTNPDALSEPAPSVLFRDFGESSLDFEVRVWTAEFDNFPAVRSALCVGFEAALRSAGIEIPFPQRDLHIRSIAAAAAKPDGAGAAPSDPEPRG